MREPLDFYVGRQLIPGMPAGRNSMSFHSLTVTFSKTKFNDFFLDRPVRRKLAFKN